MIHFDVHGYDKQARACSVGISARSADFPLLVGNHRDITAIKSAWGRSLMTSISPPVLQLR